MRHFELIEKLLVRGRLFQRVQLCPVDVLQQRVSKQIVVSRLPNDRRDGVQTRLLGSAPPSLPHDELVVTALDRAHHDRLHHAELADGVDQLRECLLVEHLARLLGVGLDGRHRDLAIYRADIGGRCSRSHWAATDDHIGGRVTQSRARRGRRTVHRCGRDQGCQASAESALTP